MPKSKRQPELSSEGLLNLVLIIKDVAVVYATMGISGQVDAGIDL